MLWILLWSSVCVLSSAFSSQREVGRVGGGCTSDPHSVNFPVPTISVNNSATVSYVTSTTLWRFYLDVTCSGNSNPLQPQLTSYCCVSIFIISSFIVHCRMNSQMFGTYSDSWNLVCTPQNHFQLIFSTITSILSFI